jgi:Fe-S oxidoreductase
VINDIKINLLSAASGLITPEVVKGIIAESTIWSCTTCGACVQECPVFIEQFPKLLKMRRYLVQMKAQFPEELNSFFENVEQRSNPWGVAPSDRSKWTSIMEVKQFAAGETEYLFYVGCAGSFDARSKQVTVANALILDAAGVSWGILGRDELCCGDSVRRLGNEYLFDRMAQDNAKLFQERGVKKVVVQCPHCYSVLKNDYRQYGLDLEVLHHSELIHKFIEDGRLRISSLAGLGSTVYHDPCYLGRHNGYYQQPRDVIAAANGSSLLELDRSRDKSFCCGAGGGRMWMEEKAGTRINIERVKEVIHSGAETICVACPYCMTMMEDGLKDERAAGIKVRDIAEVVAEALSRSNG